VVSQDDCPYCKLLKSDVLNPMLLSGDYDERVIIAELMIDYDESIKGFNGELILPSAISADYQTWVTPTLLFVDYQGKEVYKRMIGVNTVEMFGFYLDEALDGALKAVRQGEPYTYKATRKDRRLKSISDKLLSF